MCLIESIEVCQPVSESSPDDWRTSIGQILVTIRTDDGLTGYGVGGGGKAAMHVIDAVLKDLLINQSPEPVEELSAMLHKAVLPFGPEGIAMMAISGVDLALWDLRGKREKKPVAHLLNPAIELTKPIPTYRTVWDSVPAELENLTCGVKLHLGNNQPHLSRPNFASHLVNKVRDARTIIGENRPLMVDAWMSWDLETTLEFAKQVEPYKLNWIEEPLPLTDLAGYRILSNECSIPIAGGEHVFTARNFETIIEQKLHSILQPDACWVGGLTELIKIYKMADEAGLQVIPHRGSEVWGLHAIAAFSNAPLAESGRPWIDWTIGQPEIIDDMITLSREPGFGISTAPELRDHSSTLRT